jgi:hypothetical protein
MRATARGRPARPGSRKGKGVPPGRTRPRRAVLRCSEPRRVEQRSDLPEDHVAACDRSHARAGGHETMVLPCTALRCPRPVNVGPLGATPSRHARFLVAAMRPVTSLAPNILRCKERLLVARSFDCRCDTMLKPATRLRLGWLWPGIRASAVAPVAQGIEQRFPKPQVARSNRAGGASQWCQSNNAYVYATFGTPTEHAPAGAHTGAIRCADVSVTSPPNARSSRFRVVRGRAVSMTSAVAQMPL